MVVGAEVAWGGGFGGGVCMAAGCVGFCSWGFHLRVRCPPSRIC